MTITIRLDPELQKELDRAAELDGVSRSELVRECLQDYIARRKQRTTAWGLGNEVFGQYASGRSDLAANRKAILEEKLRARKDRR